MKKKMKKAFTLVELLVVIAILAVLSTVAVVGYNSFTEKANKSADEQLCTQYNTLLQAESVFDDEITLPDLIRLIEANGINAHMFDTKSKTYDFAYDMQNAKCVLIDHTSKEVVYPKNHTVSNEGLWMVYNGKLVEKIHNYYIPNALTLNEGNTLVGAEAANYIFDFDGSVFKVYDDACLAPMTSLKVVNASVVKLTNNLSKLVVDDSCEVVAARQVASASALEVNNISNWIDGLQKDVDYSKTVDSVSGKTTYTLKNVKFVSENGVTSPFGSHDVSRHLLKPLVKKYNGGVEVSYQELSELVFVFENCAFNNISIHVQANELAAIKFEGCDFTTVHSGVYAINTNSYNGMSGGYLGDITINNCTFTFSRSIALRFGVKLVVTNSTFDIFGDDYKSSVVILTQVEHNDSNLNFDLADVDFTKRGIKFENNTVNDAYSIISFHDAYTFPESTYTVELFKASILLTGNTVDSEIPVMVWEKNMPSKFAELLTYFNN